MFTFTSLLLLICLSLAAIAVRYHYLRRMRAYDENDQNTLKESIRPFEQKEELVAENYFDNLLSHPLDHQQVGAILSNDENVLVIAGAGCGKTTTIQGKVNYLIDYKLALPEEILLLSFAKMNADDLKSKLGHLGVNCRTFHSFAYQVVKAGAENIVVLPPDKYEPLLTDIHQKLLHKDKAYLSSFNDFVLNGLRAIRFQNEFNTYQAYITYLKDAEFDSLQGLVAKRKFLIHGNNNGNKGEFIKNGEVCYIANFLFLHDIAYSYESSFLYDNVLANSSNEHKLPNKYKPTFTLYLNGYDAESIKNCPNPIENLLFIDHIEIDSKGQGPKFYGTKKLETTIPSYESTVQWKKELHRSLATNYIQTYTHEFASKSLEENLIVNLTKYNVRFIRKKNEEVYNILAQVYGKELDAVLKLIQTFINLFKANKHTFSALIKSNEIQYQHNTELVLRNEQLLGIIEKVYHAYQEDLVKQGKLDFNDLINQAYDKLIKQEYKHNYKYIVIDEFQDISINRCNLLIAMKKQRKTKLFAVGDDWQSIYRFSGSDLSLFNKFKSFFGPTSFKNIETTYRFSEPLISISSKFLLKNPNQLKKNLRNPNERKTKVLFEYLENNSKHYNKALLNVLDMLYAEYGSSLKNKSIMLLGRFQHDINRFNSDAPIIVHSKDSYLQVGALRLDFQTVHKSKGLEADIVLLVNCDSGKYGFPSEITDDSILSLLLTTKEHYLNAEERRALYVAMTRAKEKFYFLIRKDKESKFIRELHQDFIGNITSPDACPRCGSSLRFIKNIEKQNSTSKLYGCSAFRYGCEYLTYRNNL